VANTFISRLRAAWNLFVNTNNETPPEDRGYATTSLPHRHRLRYGNEQSIVNAIYNRCAVDVSNLRFHHVKIDQNGSFLSVLDTGLDKCLSLSGNIDQGPEAFIQDVVISMLDEGSVAVVPVDTTLNPSDGSFDILSLRTGKVLEWFPQHVRLEVYNDSIGRTEQIILPKSRVGIVENPFYSIMNQYNSTLQRLIRKLNLLDVIDEQSGSGKLDIIIQLPYTVKHETQKLRAEQRRTDLEEQLSGSKYGVAYSDATENIVQLNRPSENNLLAQVDYLTKMLYSQLGMSEKILDGSATELELLNYYNRTIEPIASAITHEMRRKFLTPTAITQGQHISFFKDIFAIVTAGDLAELADKFTRNEIFSSNEIRAAMGYRPSSDPGANELRNKNLNKQPDPSLNATPEPPVTPKVDGSESVKEKNNGKS
jgi:hypothetical protein